MKKSIAIILFITLLIGVFPYSNIYAEKSLEDNLEMITINIKKTFNITHDYENFDSGVNTYDNTIRYYLNWSDSNKEIPDINIEVDENENIISYYKDYKMGKEDKSSAISINQAEELAQKFIKEIGDKNIEEVSKAKLSNSDPWDTYYRLEFHRLVEGLPYYEDRIYVNVDKYEKEVVNYRANWDYNIVFPNKEKVIEINKAKEILKEKLGLELIYKLKYNGYPRRADHPDFYLAYGFLNDNKAVDAISGQVISINNGPFMGIYNDSVKEESNMDSGGLTPQEKEEIVKLSGIYSKEEIEKISREVLELSKEYKLVNSNLYSSWKNKDEFLWDLYFGKDEEDDSVSISLDGKTSEIIGFYKHQNYDDYKYKKSIIDRQGALKIANNYIKKIAPKRIGKVEYMANDFSEDGKNLTFNFIRKEGDIYIEGDYINVGVNTTDKSVFSYSNNWYNGKIPPKGDIISLDRAYEILYDQIGYELMYVKTYDMDKKIENPRGNKDKIRLVYDVPPNKPVNIHAIHGNLLNNAGDEYISKKEIKYTDLDNSYAKDKIKTLADYGIGFDEERFRPKEEIMQKDFVYLLWKSLNPNRDKIKDIDKMYDELINSGIVKEEERAPDAGIRKEAAIAFIIRAMNYEEIANLKDIYKDLFIDSKDIEEEYIGHINLAYGFKIIQGNGGKIPRLNPKKKLTREDAGNIIYNYIFK